MNIYLKFSYLECLHILFHLNYYTFEDTKSCLVKPQIFWGFKICLKSSQKYDFQFPCLLVTNQL